MKINEPYLLLEINDKKFIFLVVRYKEDFNYEILDSDQVDSLGIKNGKIVDIEISSKIIKEHLNKIEKKNKFIFKSVTIINNQEDFSCINISGFKKLSGSQVSKEDISFILNDIKKLIMSNYTKKSLVHLFNSNFILDNNNLINLPIGLYGEFYSQHLTFFLLPKNDIKNMQLLLSKCDLEIDKIILKAFSEGIQKIDSIDKKINFTLIKIGNKKSSVSIFGKSSLLYSQIFSFGTDMLLKDVEKVCSIKFSEVQKIFSSNFFESSTNINKENYLDKKYFTNSRYRKISITHLFDIVEARLDEIINLIYLNNINLKYLKEENKSIYFSIEDPIINKGIRNNFKKKLITNSLDVVEDLTQQDLLESCVASAQLVGKGWEKEAIPIIHTKKSLISRIFSVLFN